MVSNVHTRRLLNILELTEAKGLRRYITNVTSLPVVSIGLRSHQESVTLEVMLFPCQPSVFLILSTSNRIPTRGQ